MILTLDIGNSRIKWGLWQNHGLVENGARACSAQTLADVLSSAWRDMAKPDGVILACVAGDAVEQSVQAWLQAHWNIEARVLRSSKQFAGITHAYENPEQHGADRWAAMIAARTLYPSAPLCVISCGTAVTLDLVDANGRHLGGQIMPGVELMIAALAERLPALSKLDAGAHRPAADIFAADTVSAVNSGVLHMQAAGLDRACEDARDRLGAGVKTLLTGGGAAAMIPLMKYSVELQADLVLQGLYIAAQAVNA